MQYLIAAFVALFPAIIYLTMRVASAAFFHEKLRYQQKLIRKINK